MYRMVKNINFKTENMKKISLLFIACLLFSSCEKEALTENVNATSPEEVKTRSMCSCCNGGNLCIPNVHIYGNSSSADIVWNAPLSEHSRYNISCDGADGYVSKYLHDVGSSGSLSFDFPDIMGDYKIACTISCAENGCDCRKSVTFKKTAGDTSGSMGSETECFKDYLPYEAEVDWQTGDLLLYLTSEGYELLENTQKYMQIDALEIYNQKRDNFGLLQLIYKQYVDCPTAPYVLKFSGLPEEPGVYYEAHLISSQCEHNDLHYIYFDYNNELSGGRVYLQTYKYH